VVPLFLPFQFKNANYLLIFLIVCQLLFLLRDQPVANGVYFLSYLGVVVAEIDFESATLSITKLSKPADNPEIITVPHKVHKSSEMLKKQ
jgi:hypothetical protein